MATLPPGTAVDLTELAADALRFPPPDGDLVIVVHPAALRAPRDRHTQVAQVVHGEPIWLGAMGEEMLVSLDAAPQDWARGACAERYLSGGRLWDVVRPGALLLPDAAQPASTVYGGSDRRPWIVIGETAAGDVIAVPLADASTPKWWAPVVPSSALDFPGNVKDSQVELAHVWTLPRTLPAIGGLAPIGRGAVERAVRAYFSV
ncbi:hypothetical protein BH23DEI1_BH23DEI1_03330 [soil metagenome]|nr:hypothetical protein [Trueperaceae bacterium]